MEKDKVKIINSPLIGNKKPKQLNILSKPENILSGIDKEIPCILSSNKLGINAKKLKIPSVIID